jgi:hypothetical protein
VQLGANPSSNLAAGPDDDPTLCPDDFFHVAVSQTYGAEIPSVAVKSHKIYMTKLTTSKMAPTTSKMTPFLMCVTKARKVTGHNVESWVTAIKCKLADIGFLTIWAMVATIPVINHQLNQIDHVQMFTHTLDIIAHKGVKVISLDNKSALAYYNTETMIVFLQRVVITKVITGKGINSWIEKMHSKLHSIGILSIRAMVSGILMLYCKLFASGLQLMHNETIEVMAQEGVNALLLEALGPQDAWEQANHDDGDRTCPNCDDTGDIGDT